MLLYLVVVAAFCKVSCPVADVTDERTTRHKIAGGEGQISTILHNMTGQSHESHYLKSQPCKFIILRGHRNIRPKLTLISKQNFCPLATVSQYLELMVKMILQ